MKIIGIFGGSGSGKSTTARLLNQLLDNSVIIPMDKYMHMFVDIHTDMLCEKFGITEKPAHPLSFFARKAGSNKYWVDLIKKDVEEATKDEIGYYNDEDFVILDWAFLNYSDLFEICDYTIYIDSDEELKFQRLKERLSQAGKLDHWSDAEIRRRAGNSKYDYGNVIPTFTIIDDPRCNYADTLIAVADSIANEQIITK